MLTAQEIFDKSVNQIRKQGCRAAAGSECRYRLGVCTCGVGALIDNEHYTPEMEGISINSIIRFQETNRFQDCFSQLAQVTAHKGKLLWTALKKSGVDADAHFTLLKDLQLAHDVNFGAYENEVRDIAIKHKLVYTEKT